MLSERPESGDIFLQRSFRGKDVIHAGLVMTVNGYGCLDEHTVYDETATIEGDTDHRGLLGRGYTCKLRRRLSPTLGGEQVIPSKRPQLTRVSAKGLIFWPRAWTPATFRAAAPPPQTGTASVS
jgi:hypothetical protein